MSSKRDMTAVVAREEGGQLTRRPRSRCERWGQATRRGARAVIHSRTYNNLLLLVLLFFHLCGFPSSRRVPVSGSAESDLAKRARSPRLCNFKHTHPYVVRATEPVRGLNLNVCVPINKKCAHAPPACLAAESIIT